METVTRGCLCCALQIREAWLPEFHSLRHYDQNRESDGRTAG